LRREVAARWGEDVNQCQTKGFCHSRGTREKRAEEILTRAETFQDAYAKQKMGEIAAKYEDLAERLEQAAET
jgi:hypothetical protein